MADQITRLKVFIASPGDLPEEERDVVRIVCDSLNRTPDFINSSIFLQPCGYETDVYPGVLEEHPQMDLTRLAEESDILIAIFHRKLGGAGQHSRSGTVEEIEAGIQQISNVAASFFMLAEPLVRISMTLHRMEQYRIKGLELFEQLLESDINEARQALDLLDRRPTLTNVPVRRPRRRRIT